MMSFYKIAVTSGDRKHIDQHFGQASSFCIFKMEEETGKWELLNQIRVEEKLDRHSDIYLQYVLKMLDGCKYILTQRIGGRPYTILKQMGIDVIEAPSDIDKALEKLNKYHIRRKINMKNARDGHSLI